MVTELENEDTDVSSPSPAPKADVSFREVARDTVGVPSAVFEELTATVPGPNPRFELTMFWRDARMSVVSLEAPRAVTVGIGAVDLPATLPAHLSDKFVIAEPAGKGMELRFDTSMRIEVRGEDEMPLSLDRLVKLKRVDAGALSGKGVYSVKLEPRERVAIVIGDVTIAARWVPATKQVVPKPFAWLDRNFAAVLVITLVAHIVALTAVLVTPPEPSNELPIEMLENPTRVAKLVLEERARKKPEPRIPVDAAGSKGGKRKGDEGAVGRPSDQKDAAASKPGAPRVDPRKRSQDRRVALSSGLLQVLGEKPSGATANVFGPGGLGSGINEALGGLRGRNQGEAGGVGGSGGRGTGLGGGGKSLGIGGVGDGKGTGKGLTNVELGGRGRATEVVPGRTVIKGCLSDQVVGRVVTRHLTQVKFCYEKELQRFPDLAGKVVAAFTIGGRGEVLESRVAESTLGNTAVEQCLMRVVGHMTFPPCEGGGTAEVTYPWLFKPGGE
ncbi:MAG: AgmX/PglI C-terminal domain-containing protein [Myxococcota bacterium]